MEKRVVVLEERLIYHYFPEVGESDDDALNNAWNAFSNGALKVSVHESDAYLKNEEDSWDTIPK